MRVSPVENVEMSVLMWKITGDTNYMQCQIMVSDLIGEVDHNYMQKMKLRQHFPVAYCINDKNISHISSFIPAYLVKIGKNLWEVMDKHNEEMEKQLTGIAMMD